MKNYFNQYEASNHLILMTAMLPTKNFIDGDCITEEERKMLKKVIKLVDRQQCGIYKIKSYLHYEGKSDTPDLCPFRKAELDLPQIDLEDF